MNLKMIGALLTLAACGYVGFSDAAAYRRGESQLQQLLLALEFMDRELRSRMPALPELCDQTARHCRGAVQRVFRALDESLRAQTAPEAFVCMEAAVEQVHPAENVAEKLRLLGQTLGRFDLQGQLAGIATVRELAGRDLAGVRAHRDEHIRSCRTLALCAGAALVILLI